MNHPAFGSILEKRKSDIVTAVLRLVDKVGITGLTTKRIAKEVGFVEGALYKHVDSKIGVFHLILDASVKSIEETDVAIARQNLSPVDALGAWYEFAVSFLEEYPGIYRILFSDGLYVEDRVLFNKFKECLLHLTDKLRKILESGVKSGAFRSDIDVETTAVMFLGVIDMTFMLWTVFEERARSYQVTARPFFEEYLRSLRSPSPEVSHV